MTMFVIYMVVNCIFTLVILDGPVYSIIDWKSTSSVIWTILALTIHSISFLIFSLISNYCACKKENIQVEPVEPVVDLEA